MEKKASFVVKLLSFSSSDKHVDDCQRKKEEAVATCDKKNSSERNCMYCTACFITFQIYRLHSYFLSFSFVSVHLPIREVASLEEKEFWYLSIQKYDGHL